MPLICFASPKGGVGKTTLAANIADALRRDGRRVLAMDFDPQNTLRLHFGVPLNDHAGFLTELPKRPDWRALTRQTASGVMLLPHGAIDIRGALGLSTNGTLANAKMPPPGSNERMLAVVDLLVARVRQGGRA